jgi:putative membrane protein
VRAARRARGHYRTARREREVGVPGFLVRTLISAAGLWLASLLVSSIAFASGGALLLAAFLLGVVNALVRPIAVLLTLPITVLTLGVFLLFVNGAMLGLVAWLLPGFSLGGTLSAVLGALIVSATSWVASWYVGPRGRFEILVVERGSGPL